MTCALVIIKNFGDNDMLTFGMMMAVAKIFPWRPIRWWWHHLAIQIFVGLKGWGDVGHTLWTLLRIVLIIGALFVILRGR